MKENIINIIRAVPISGKTYEKYVEAVADRLCSEDYRKASEVALKLIRKVEKIAKKHNAVSVLAELAELKKKYTEEKK